MLGTSLIDLTFFCPAPTINKPIHRPAKVDRTALPRGALFQPISRRSGLGCGSFFENKLNIWLNGKQINQYYGTFVLLNQINVGVKEVGIVSLYNRDLNKLEMIQHFVDYHVENFTNDEVLI